ncbi:MAG: L-rhamnose mutarotase [Sedimentisphaerales bacterium]|nr:L-rhamnose mutarotase [Sedimentisphaerales bacterium]
MERVCFLLQVKRDKVDEYLKVHDVWPEMLEEMKKAGLRNYSLFLRPDGLVVGYLEADNVQEAFDRLGQTEVNKRWQEKMAEFFEAGSGDLKEGDIEFLKSYFYMA